MAPVLMVLPVTVTELPELLSVVMLAFRVTLVEPVMATVLMLVLPPIVPTATVLVEPPDEVMVISRDPEAALIVPILMAPPAELIVQSAPRLMFPKVSASSELLIDVFNVTVPATLDVLSPPLKVKLSPVASPKVKVPSLASVDAALNVLVPPVKLTLATVLSALNAAAATLLLKVAVPPTSARVRLPKPAMAPLAVISAPAILLPVESVRLLELPAKSMAAIVMSPAFELALVSMVVALPSVTVPKTMASFDVAIVPLSVTVPPTLVVVKPPLKVSVPPLVPNIKVPSLAKETALTTDDPLPTKAKFATVLPMVKVVTSTSLKSVAVPPTSARVKVVTAVILFVTLTSDPAILLPVDRVRLLEPPVMAPLKVISAPFEVALVSIVVSLPRVTAPKVNASSELAMVPFRVTVPLLVSPPL